MLFRPVLVWLFFLFWMSVQFDFNFNSSISILDVRVPPWVQRESHFDSPEQISLALSIPAVQSKPLEENKRSLAHRPSWNDPKVTESSSKVAGAFDLSSFALAQSTIQILLIWLEKLKRTRTKLDRTEPILDLYNLRVRSLLQTWNSIFKFHFMQALNLVNHNQNTLYLYVSDICGVTESQT